MSLVQNLSALAQSTDRIMWGRLGAKIGMARSQLKLPTGKIRIGMAREAILKTRIPLTNLFNGLQIGRIPIRRRDAQLFRWVYVGLYIVT